MAITIEDCKKIINRYTNDDSLALSFKTIPLSDIPVGFLGDHFRLIISYKNPQNRRLSASFFLKTIPRGNANFTDYVTGLGVFRKEAMLYKHLINEFQKHHDQPIAPKSYLVNPESFIVLEDLSLKGFTMVDRVNHENMIQLMKTLARFHSSSIIYEEKRSFEDKPYRLINHFADELKETTFSPIEGEYRYRWGMTTSKAVMDTMLLRSEHYRQIGERFIQFARKDIFEYVFPSSKYRNMINHADLWKNNALFHRNGCVIIDYQLVRYTPPALDILTALHINCTGEYLKQNFEFLLDVYYNTFKESLEKHQIPIDTVLKRSEFDESLKEYEIASLTEAAMFATIIFIGEDFAQKMSSDEDCFNEFTYTDRSKYILEEINNNPMFERKYSDILDRLIDCLFKRYN